MADTTITGYLSSYDQIQANHEKYADKFADNNKDLVNSETFLNLLVAEMTNQDPLEPTSNTEFVTQMAQFTQLQYAQDSSTYAKANYAASLVGKTVTASKMDGAELVTKTGVVESVVKSGDSYTVSVGGESFDISKINSVAETTDKSESTDGTSGVISGTNALGDTIARASMMIGMYATVKAKTDSGEVVDAGIIDSIQVKNGEVHIVLGDISYKLSDVVEVKYPEFAGGTEGTEPAPEVGDTSAESDIVEEQLYEMLDELMADIQQDEDVQDLIDIEETEEA